MTQTFAPNTERFVDALARIERSPRMWQQGSWIEYRKTNPDEPEICTTAGCLAGWVCLANADGHPVIHPTALEKLNDGRIRIADGTAWQLPNGKIEPIDDLSNKLLGLPDDIYQALDDGVISEAQFDAMEGLYAGGNSKDKLYELISEITGLSEYELRQRVAVRSSELAEIEAKQLPKPVIA